MSNLEITENLNPKQDATEWVGSTEICNFEGCHLINSEQLANYLHETVPPSHLEGCSSIAFDPNHPVFLESPNTLGFFETNSHRIHISDETRFPNGSEDVLNTITHELGHNVQACLIEKDPELSEKWKQLYQESWDKVAASEPGFVSEYAKTNQHEDFAESYRAYIRDPEKLQILAPEKYQFMHDYVFAGRE